MPENEILTAPPRWTPPIGLGTVAGFGTGSTSLVAALVDAIVGGGIDSDTRTLIVSGLAAIVLTALGRMYQAGQKYAAGHGVALPDIALPGDTPTVPSGLQQ